MVSFFSEDAEAPPSTQILVSGLVDDVYGDFRPTTDRPPNDVIYCSVDDMIFETQVRYLFIFCLNVYVVLLHELLHCVHLMNFVLKKWSDLNELAANYFDGSGYVLRDHMKVVKKKYRNLRKACHQIPFKYHTLLFSICALCTGRIGEVESGIVCLTASSEKVGWVLVDLRVMQPPRSTSVPKM